LADGREQQAEVKTGAEILGETNDGSGIAHWRSSMLAMPSRTPLRMEGILVATLADDGRCTFYREWWNEDPPATGAGEYS
jgi:hypothetical protein